MLLKEWKEKNNISNTQLAKLLTVNMPRISEYFSGQLRFSAKICVKIEDLTKGEVTRSEVMWPELYTTEWKYNPRKKAKKNERS